MCGLNCIISKNNNLVDPHLLKEMNDLIIHRGPDDEGYYKTDWMGLGFRRLAIIDLSSGGHQPMLDKTGRYVCTFNGEIYNYLELRESLKGLGVEFKSNSDTEVVINAYIQWGPECLSKFIGMFAIIIADLQNKSVFIARDQLGIKPLYYTEDSNFYYFSSEIKAFQAVIKLTPDPETYFEQFIFRYISGERTNFLNVKKVLPAHYWQYNFSRDKFKKHKYFDLKKSFNSKNTTTQLKKIDQALEDSAIFHTRSDVGYALQLSGGVDSSYLASLISRKSEKRLMTFSIELKDAQFDESIYQNYVAEKYHTEHYSIQLDCEDYFNNLEKASYHMDAPIVHGGCVFLMVLSREISKRTKVVLTGEGADELFAGYQRYLSNWNNKVANIIRSLRIPSKVIPALWKLKGLKHFMSDDLIYYSQKYNTIDNYSALFVGKENVIPYRNSTSNRSDFDYLRGAQYYDQTTYLCSLLDRQDKMSMAASVEARVPYCNPLLFNAINPIPSKQKVRHGNTKSLLKACASSEYPASFLNRRKNGLLLPYDKWFRGNAGMSEYFSLLTDSVAKARGIYNNRNIELAIDRFRKGDNKYIKPLFSLIHMEVWHRVFSF